MLSDCVMENVGGKGTLLAHKSSHWHEVVREGLFDRIKRAPMVDRGVAIAGAVQDDEMSFVATVVVGFLQCFVRSTNRPRAAHRRICATNGVCGKLEQNVHFDVDLRF